MRFPRLSIPFAVLTLAVLLPARASALAAPPACTITGTEKARCLAQLCGPAGNFDYHWSGPDRFLANSQCVTVQVSGTYRLIVVNRDDGTKSQPCFHDIFIDKCGENRPPDCSRASARVLWPPNHELEAVVIEGVVDPDGDPVAITVVGITQDEPLDANGDGSTCADAEIVDGVGFVRSERTGDVNNPGNGRVYMLRFFATDIRGLTCKGQVAVCVPHDMGQSDTCVDDGQLYDSLGDCESP